MEVLEIKESEDGSTDVTVNISKDEFGVFLRYGMQKVADEYKEGQYKVLKASGDIPEGVKQVEISDEMVLWLLNVGLVEVGERITKEER